MDSGNSRLFRPSSRSNPNPSTRPPETRMKPPEWTKDDLNSPAVKENWDLRLLACCMPWTMSVEDGNSCCDVRIWCHGSLPSDPGHTCLDPLLSFFSRALHLLIVMLAALRRAAAQPGAACSRRSFAIAATSSSPAKGTYWKPYEI